MHLNSKNGLIARLRRGRKAREQFVDSHLSKGISHQIRATRELFGWSQERLAKESGMNQNAISRLESLSYGKATITTLKRIAASLDVGLVVRFVPFSEMVDWVTGTPRMIDGLTTSALAVSCFEAEESAGIFEPKATNTASGIRVGAGAAEQANPKNPQEPLSKRVVEETISPSIRAAMPAHLTQIMASSGALRAGMQR